MDKKIAGLLGVMSAFAVAAPAMAAPVPTDVHGAMQAASYADLLKPIPNATEMLRASDAVLTDETPAVETVAYHHHHHVYRRHRRYYRR